jgi:hypothetical protein
MNNDFGTARRIRQHLGEVFQLQTQRCDLNLETALEQIKHLQSLRFRATYIDFMKSPMHVAATRFFLEELYGKADFTERDAQFDRIAGAIERLFPISVGNLAADLAEIHALSERLDHEMAERWLSIEDRELSAPRRYVLCWRATGQREQRIRQLTVVLQLGRELQRLTQIKSILLGLKMMRKPASLAGLTSLQRLLERGFAAFQLIGNADSFLTAIECRESSWIAEMFDADENSCAKQLEADLSKAKGN